MGYADQILGGKLTSDFGFLMVFSGQVAAGVVASIWPPLFLFMPCQIQNSLLFNHLIFYGY